MSSFHALFSWVLTHNRLRPYQVLQSWASEGFFPEGGTRGFFQKFLWGAKSGVICFFPLETVKTTFFAEILKIPPPPSNAHGCNLLWFCILMRFLFK